MTKNQIQQLLDNLGTSEETKLIETHISWVILTKAFVYKIKKPLKFSFLDFSTLEKRHHFCLIELKLNRRLTTDMYLDVVSIRKVHDRITVNSGIGQVIDYAVKMKHMDGSRQMNLLLEKNIVTSDHMDQVAETLSKFHKTAEVLHTKANTSQMHEDYADILRSEKGPQVGEYISAVLGHTALENIRKSISVSARFLQEHAQRLQQRTDLGFIIDGHGDLHSRNIFLLDQPVIFDCIEFNEHFRQLDVLDELAFFCMDLELYDRRDLADYFLQRYERFYPCILEEADQRIFNYYKLYRANVKIKVNALKALQMTDKQNAAERTALMRRYYRLFQAYLEGLYHLE